MRVKYLPSRATMADLQAITENSEDTREQVRRIVDQFLELVQDWDLTEEDGETKIPLTAERLMNIPASIFRTVLTNVMKDQNVGEAESSSAGG